MKKIFSSSAFSLVVAIIIGALVGLISRQLTLEDSTLVCKTLAFIKSLSGQIIFFMVPFLILGCVTPSIAKMSGNASKILLFTMTVAYLSSVSSALISLVFSRFVVPSISIATHQSVTNLPVNPLGNFTLPTIHPMCALAISIAVGLGLAWLRIYSTVKIMEDFQKFMLSAVRKIMMPLLPLFIGSNFALLTYTGQISNMGIFLPVLIMVVLCQLVWIFVVYFLASIYSGKNGWIVLRHYTKAYFTALGSMSSVATLPISLECIEKSKIVDKKTFDFTIPMLSNSNLCGSVIAEIALLMATYFVFYQAFPPIINIILFVITSCVLSIGSPGVPGGLNVACSTILGSLILNGGQIDTFMGVMTALYTLQDGFGTACNVVTGGALTIIVEKKFAKVTQSTDSTVIPLVSCD